MLLHIIGVVVVLGVVFALLPMDARFKNLAYVLAVILIVVLLLNFFGIFSLGRPL